MKICAIICEYNPFHNGHFYHIQRAKELSGADAIVCLMSGNFVQRGEAAILDKYVRAKHAVLAGADAVLELPTIFATSNAELFSKGAVHILSSIPNVTTLCFGAEKAEKNAFLLGARYLANEPQEVSQRLQEELSQGVSFAKARANAFAGFVPYDLLCSPNNVLGLEYTKAILQSQANIDILPIQRMGRGYADTQIDSTYASATAIRLALANGQDVTDNVPLFVKKDLENAIPIQLDTLEKYAVLSRTTSEIAAVCDCTEGLENALKKAAILPQTLIETLTSSRYTASRIRRIALQNLLKIDENTIRKCLQAPLYLTPLAVNVKRQDILSVLSKSSFPLLMRAHDDEQLVEQAKICLEIERFADRVYGLYNPVQKPKNIFIEQPSEP